MYTYMQVAAWWVAIHPIHPLWISPSKHLTIQLSCPANKESNPTHEIGTEFKSQKIHPKPTLITLRSLEIKFHYSLNFKSGLAWLAHNSAYGYP